MSKKVATIRDIAQATNLGKSTVARALTNKGGVSEKNRELIIKKAKELNYKTNMIYSIMASRRSNLLNSNNLIPIAFLHGAAPGHLLGFLNEHIKTFGFYLEVLDLSDSANVAKVQRWLYELGIVGVVLYSIDYEILSSIDFSNYSVVSIHRGENTKQIFNNIRPDRFHDFVFAWERAIEMGHRKIGAAIARQDISSQDDALRYGAACECLHFWRDSIINIPPYLGEVLDIESFLEWFDKYRPTCVLGFQVHHYWALIDHGVKIPEEVSFIALICGNDNPEITGLKNIDEQLIKTSLTHLNQLIRSNSCGQPDPPISIYIRANWYKGESLSNAEHL